MDGQIILHEMIENAHRDHAATIAAKGHPNAADIDHHRSRVRLFARLGQGLRALWHGRDFAAPGAPETEATPVASPAIAAAAPSPDAGAVAEPWEQSRTQGRPFYRPS